MIALGSTGRNDLLPDGFLHYALGGMLIGLGIGLVFALTGRRAGVSSFFTVAHSWWSASPRFRSAAALDERTWKLRLVVGIVLGAAAVHLLRGEAFVTGVPGWRLAVGGILVGYGTRMARGCTSGHGICGVASWSRPSLLSTAVFVGVAILTAQVLAGLGAAVGGTP